MAIDETYGGMGFGFETLCLLVEEVGRTVAPVPVVPVLVSAVSTLQKFASDELKQRYLPAVACGEQLLTAAIIEPGSDNAARPKTTAVKTAQGWLLNGSKHSVPFAANAQRILLTAQSDQGLVVLLLDPQANGVTLNRQQVTAGEPQYEILMDDVAATELVAEGAPAQALAQWLFESTAAAYSAMATGLCDKMMRMDGFLYL